MAEPSSQPDTFLQSSKHTTLWPITHDDPELLIQLDNSPPQKLAADEYQIWQKLKSLNPRLYNSPIITITSFTPPPQPTQPNPAPTLHCQLDHYARLAIADTLSSNITVLSITGLLVSTDINSDPCILLGKRSKQTRIYGDSWELAPSGTLDPDLNPAHHITNDLLNHQLSKELSEEISSDFALKTALPIAIMHDPVAHSLDIIMRADLASPPPPLPTDTNWEYQSLRWLSKHKAPDFIKQNLVITPTLAVLKHLDWIT